MKLIYIRAGYLPKGGKSQNHLTEKYEKGISVYEAIKKSNNSIYFLLPSMNASACVGLSSVFQGNHGMCKPLFEVTGDRVGHGSDGEPVLKNCVITRRLKSLERKINRRVPLPGK